MRARDIPARDRLLAKLVPQPNGCWHWVGVIDKAGHGRVGYKGRRSEPIQRAVYDCLVGPIPDGMHVDHVCHSSDPDCPGGPTCLHRRCGNPAHLEPVTPLENALRAHRGIRAATHCINGHEYTEENSYYRPYDGKRLCVACYEARAGHPPARRAAA